MTAIEWLEKRFYFTKGQLIDIDFKQAKAMEKEQMNKCYHPLTERKHTSDIHFECTICGYNNY